jgi:hypothetical protein
LTTIAFQTIVAAASYHRCHKEAAGNAAKASLCEKDALLGGTTIFLMVLAQPEHVVVSATHTLCGKWMGCQMTCPIRTRGCRRCDTPPPLLAVTGKMDDQIPGERIRHGVRVESANKPVELIEFPDEGHLIVKSENIRRSGTRSSACLTIHVAQRGLSSLWGVAMIWGCRSFRAE